MLARLEEAGLSPEERAAIEQVARDLLEMVAMLGKAGVTMEEIRARFPDRGRG